MLSANPSPHYNFLLLSIHIEIPSFHHLAMSLDQLMMYFVTCSRESEHDGWGADVAPKLPKQPLKPAWILLHVSTHEARSSQSQSNDQ